MNNVAKSEAKLLTIIMTDRPPVRIRVDQWPVIAEGEADWVDKVENEGMDWTRKVDVSIVLRRHADGRILAYGGYRYRSRWMNESNETYEAGFLHGSANAPIANADECRDLCEIIEEVGNDLIARGGNSAHVNAAVRSAINDLPAEDI